MLRVEIRSKSVPSAAGPRIVIEGLQFELARDEIVALVGPSGCGKTTVLRIVAGLDTAFEGRVEWLGGRPRIGTVFQEPRLLPWRTVRQNLALVRPPDPSRAETLLEALGVPHVADLYPPALSLGMARRVAIARAFAFAPDVLLLDEPFVSLDPAAADAARAVFLNTWRARPSAALLVTHDRAEAASLADRIMLLSAGGPARVIDIPAQSRRRGMTEGARVAASLT